MIYLARICVSDPDGDIKFCCFNFTIKKKIYPVVIIGIVAVMTFSLPMDMILGYMVGLIQCKFLNGTMIRLSLPQYLRIENSFLFNCIS